MVGPHYHFILSKYFILKLHFSLHFFPFFSTFDNILLATHNKMFRVGKPETHICFLSPKKGLNDLSLLPNCAGLETEDKTKITREYHSLQ